MDLFLCFLMCTVSAEKPTFMMMLNQTTDILWQAAAAVAIGFYWLTTKLLFIWLGLGTFFPPKNLCQSLKFLVQSQSIIDENF